MRFLLLPALLAAACATVRDTPIPAGWTDVPHAPAIASVSWSEGRFVAGGAPPRRGPARVTVVHTATGDRIVNGDQPITPPQRIESFDYSAERHEVVLSAAREQGFDLALAADDGSELKWLPSDPADEVQVQWAPAGNKITYVVRGRNTSYLRTLHIPTSAQLTVDFPFASIRSFAYEPTGQRYGVVYSSPDASERLESMKYGGEERRMEIPPAVTLDVEVDWRDGAVLLRPAAMRYNERLPLVVWSAADPLAWSDARAALLKSARVAIAIVKERPGDAFWSAMRALPWIDGERTFVVGDSGPAGAIAIRGANGVPAGRYRRSGNVVEAPPAVVESFAAAFVADQLKRTSPPDGHDR